MSYKVAQQEDGRFFIYWVEKDRKNVLELQ